MCFNPLVDLTQLRWVRHAVAAGALACASLAGAEVATQADLSMLTDFGVQGGMNVIGASDSAHIATINQVGGNNRAMATQGNGNNQGQIWQLGDNNSALVEQYGDMNSVRLWQQGYGHTATLNQIGAANKIAAAQYESGSMLSGTQEGYGNVAALVMMGESKLSFQQQGDYNSIVATVPATVAMTITQIGNRMSTNIAP